MKYWLTKNTFPNLLYCRVTNNDEYISAITELKNVLNFTVHYGSDAYTNEIQPFDDYSWNEYFLNINSSDALNPSIDMLKKKPLDSEYPVVLSFSCNHSYLHWISLSDIL